MTLSKTVGRLVWTVLCVSCLACATTNTTPSTSNDPLSKYDAVKLREMGEKFLAGGDSANAMRYFTLADQKQPNDPLIQYDLGDACDSKGLQELALQHFLQAVTLKPDYSEAHNALGKIYAEQGRNEEAFQAFQRALANPFYQTPYYPLFNLGLLYENQGNLQAALSHYQRAVQAGRGYSMAHLRMGKVLEALGRKDEAREAYGNAIRVNPNMAEAHLAFGRLSLAAGDLENAQFSFGRVVHLRPKTQMAAEAEKYLQSIEASARR
jgi:type IV pilus assembly protein PilF